MADEPSFENEPVEEYDLMLALDRLESLREDLEEAGFGSLPEIEAALALTGGNTETEKAGMLESRRAKLVEIREEMLDLEVETYNELNYEIKILHTRLDEDDEF